MWNEHFGISVVEYMAAGLVTVAHKSGGPQADIVVPYNGAITGFLAEGKPSAFAHRITSILRDFIEHNNEQLELRANARRRCFEFSDEAFEIRFLKVMETIIPCTIK